MITVNYGTDWANNTYDALVDSDIDNFLRADYSVAIKPNLVVSQPASEGATTHPEVVEGIIRFLKDFGVSRVKIMESAWVGDNTKKAYKACGYTELSKRYGIDLIDLKDDSSTTLSCDGLDISICDEALGADFLINVPVLKAHCQTLVTNAMKNLKGCISDAEKRRFHTLGLEKPIAALNMLLKTGYVVVDGICGDLSYEGGGSPVEANRVIVGRNPLTVDSFCAELIGYSPDEVGYMAHGKRLGVGEYFSAHTKVTELHADHKPPRQTTSANTAGKYRQQIKEDGACSACYAALVFALRRLDIQQDRKIYIGQGFKGKSGDGLGIGSCARGFTLCVPGCPPTATDIIKGLS